MVIYLDQYRKAKTITMAGMQRHAEAKLCVNGTPAIGVTSMPRAQRLNALSPQLPEDFCTVDIDALYDRVYALASQI